MGYIRTSFRCQTLHRFKIKKPSSLIKLFQLPLHIIPSNISEKIFSIWPINHYHVVHKMMLLKKYNSSILLLMQASSAIITRKKLEFNHVISRIDSIVKHRVILNVNDKTLSHWRKHFIPVLYIQGNEKCRKSILKIPSSIWKTRD